MTEEELIARASRGDRTAFELLYERHWRAVYSYAWLLTRTVADAEDLTQETFLALLRKPAAFDPSRAQLRTWLIAVARRQYWRRRRDTAREASSDDTNLSEVPAGFDEELIGLERAETVRRAVAALPEPQREALYLFEYEELSLKEIAGLLDLDPNAIKARLYRARENLKRLLAGLAQAKKESL